MEEKRTREEAMQHLVELLRTNQQYQTRLQELIGSGQSDLSTGDYSQLYKEHVKQMAATGYRLDGNFDLHQQRTCKRVCGSSTKEG